MRHHMMTANLHDGGARVSRSINKTPHTHHQRLTPNHQEICFLLLTLFDNQGNLCGSVSSPLIFDEPNFRLFQVYNQSAPRGPGAPAFYTELPLTCESPPRRHQTLIQIQSTKSIYSRPRSLRTAWQCCFKSWLTYKR